MPAEFSKVIAGWGDKAARKLVAAPRILGSELLDIIVAASPVKTGRYLANHIVSLDAPDDSYDEDARDPDGEQTIENGAEVLAEITVDTQKLYIQNNAPYARRLEYGWSQQAPTGVYRLAALQMQDIVRGRLRFTDNE